MDRGREKYMHALSTQTNTQSMGQDNNIECIYAYNTMSGWYALGQCIG
jgi:allophanate hydrolase subunit 1